MQTCERCRATVGGYELHDYCATCGRNLCASCMQSGCCGHTPAASGMDTDHIDSTERDDDARSIIPSPPA